MLCEVIDKRNMIQFDESKHLTCARVMICNMSQDPRYIVADLCVNSRTVTLCTSVTPTGYPELNVLVITFTHERSSTITLQKMEYQRVTKKYSLITVISVSLFHKTQARDRADENVRSRVRSTLSIHIRVRISVNSN